MKRIKKIIKKAKWQSRMAKMKYQKMSMLSTAITHFTKLIDND